jgi:hypothetical protein
MTFSSTQSVDDVNFVHILSKLMSNYEVLMVVQPTVTSYATWA